MISSPSAFASVGRGRTVVGVAPAGASICRVAFLIVVGLAWRRAVVVVDLGLAVVCAPPGRVVPVSAMVVAEPSASVVSVVSVVNVVVGDSSSGAVVVVTS